jgi:hypothetical protein
LMTPSINGARAKGFEMKLHPPGLYLGEVEDVVDQREQMPAGAKNAIERLKVLPCRLRVLTQHLADADDGVQRRAQLVAHVGEKLGLVLARLCELSALVLDFIDRRMFSMAITAWSAKVVTSTILGRVCPVWVKTRTAVQRG